MHELDHFDKSSRWYDRLSNFVFGNRLIMMERACLPALPHAGTILWVGGGSGVNLPTLIESRPDLSILYLDTSEKMRELARERISGYDDGKVEFLNSYSQIGDFADKIDTVMLFYVLDLFSEKDLTEALSHWGCHHGHWTPQLLVADFDRPTSWPGSMLSGTLIPMMYLFFRFAIGLPSHKLPDWKRILREMGYVEESHQSRLMGVLRSGCWRRSTV